MFSVDFQLLGYNKNIMKAKILTVILIVVVLLIAGVLIFKNQKENKMTDQINIQNDSKEITLSEVANHSTQSDCWIAIEGGVYDVTDFISHIPPTPILTELNSPPDTQPESRINLLI